MQLKAYNSVFCGVEIINDLLEDKYLFLDNQMNFVCKQRTRNRRFISWRIEINQYHSINPYVITKVKRESVIILIDEPEVGLHLKRQSKLMDALGNLLRVHQTGLSI